MPKAFNWQRSLLPTAGSIVAIFALLAIWKIPQWQVEPLQQQIDILKSQKKPVEQQAISTLEKSKLDAENASRLLLVQGVGGLLVFATVFISWRTLKATQEKQVAERFSKAVEQLGNENVHVCLGGIYALEQIAKDAEEKYYWQVMETLTSYVRERSPYPSKAAKKHSSFIQAALKETANEQPESKDNMPPLEIDIQTAMTVLTRRKHTYPHRLEPHRLDLHKIDLRQLRLPPNANLQGAILLGANLQGATLWGANLQKAKLGEANLQEAKLGEANLQEAALWKTNLQNTLLRGANLRNTILRGANLQGANLQGANLQGAKLKESDPHIIQRFGEPEVTGLTWEQLNQTSSYEGALLPDYLLHNLQPIQKPVVKSPNQGTESAQSRNHEKSVQPEETLPAQQATSEET